MSLENSTKLIRIDQKNSICYFTVDSIIDFKSSLYEQLLELDDIDTNFVFFYIHKKYFNPNSKSFLKPEIRNDYNIFDLFYLNLCLSKKFQKNELNLNDQWMEDLMKKEIYQKTHLQLNEETTHEIGKVICYLSSFLESKHHIKNEKSFLSYIENYFKFERNKENINLNGCDDENPIRKKTSISSCSDLDRRSTKCSSFKSFDCSKRLSYYSKLNILRKHSPAKDENTYFYNEINKEYKNLKSNKISKIEVLFNFLEMLSNVKELKIVLPDCSSKQPNTILNYLALLVNLKWLFSNLEKINIDFEYIKENYSVNEDASDDNQSLISDLSRNEQIYELKIFILFYVSKLLNSNKTSKYNYSFSLNLPECFRVELDYILRKEKFLVNNFHILDLIDINSNVSELNLCFNSFDSNSFQRVLSIIHKNNNLQNLSLDLFPNSSVEYFSTINLLKMANLNQINVPTAKVNYNYCTNYNTNFSSLIDENENLLNRLSLQYEKNLEYLIFILSRKVHNLKKLKINFDIPEVFFISDKYSNIFHKFLLNIFLLFHFNDTHENDTTIAPSGVEDLEISSYNFNFNSKKNPYLNEFLRKCGMKNNNVIKRLFLKMKFTKIHYLENIFSKNIKSLSLSDLDTSTFQSYIEYLTNCNIIESLEEIHITLSVVFDMKRFDLITNFFKEINLKKKVKNLKVITLNLENLPFNDENIMNIFKLEKNSDIEYNLIFSSKYMSEDFICKVLNNTNFINHNGNIELFKNLFFSFDSKYKLDAKGKYNILKTINDFLGRVSRNRIKIQIKDKN